MQLLQHRNYFSFYFFYGSSEIFIEYDTAEHSPFFFFFSILFLFWISCLVERDE